MSRMFVFPACALALGLAAQASAVAFRFQFETPMTNASGTYSVNATSSQIVNLATSGGQTATSLAYSFTPGAGGSFTSGTGTVASAIGSLNFTFMGDSSSTGMNGTILTFTSGTGAYTGFNGSGVVSHTINTFDPNYVDGQFYANVQATPEPASLLAIGTASVALIRRRTRRVVR